MRIVTIGEMKKVPCDDNTVQYREVRNENLFDW